MQAAKPYLGCRAKGKKKDGIMKPTLLRLIKQSKPHKVQYSVDKTVENQGHTALRLPPNCGKYLGKI
jgi:hypothetical protein